MRTVLRVAGAFGLGSAAVWLLLARKPSAQLPERASGRATRMTESRPVAGRSELQATGRELPPDDMPLVQAVDSLRAAASAGNGAAGCRLAMELLRCQSWRHDVVLANPPPVPPDLSADRKANLERGTRAAAERVERLRPACEGVKEGSEREAWRLLLQAALDGHVPSMTKFGGRVAIQPHPNDEYDLEPFAQYRAHALDFLTRAAAAGDARAYVMLGSRMMSRGDSGTRAIPFDPVRGIAYMKALARNAEPGLRDSTLASMRHLMMSQKIDAADELRAEPVAAELEGPLKPVAPVRLVWAEDEMRTTGFGCVAPTQRPNN
jgi:hypothetical protein